ADFPVIAQRAREGAAAERAAAALRLADLLFVAGDFEGAEQMARSALSFGFQRKAAIIEMSSLARRGDTAAAQARFEQLVRAHGNEPWMQHMRR
ncbi:MAG TPA: hypothetical protein VJR89_36255, partial [Polyangiales bacterium]|nr:hypothetical protein [Polyangiales bacterium]